MNKSNKYLLFTLVVVLTSLITMSMQYLFLNTDQIYYQSYQYLSISNVDKIFEFSKKWQWLNYAMLPIIILLRVFYTSIFLYVGVFFVELKIKFGMLLKVALLADFVYVFSGIAKLIILIFFKEVTKLDDLQFTPLSIMELVDSSSLEALFIYPLSLLNIFELGYFLLLAWLLVDIVKQEDNEIQFGFGKSLKLVSASYGSGLLLWVVLVMFITLNLS